MATSDQGYESAGHAHREAAEGLDHEWVRVAGRHAAGHRRLHERHELVREPGHGAADADAADVGAATHPVDPPAFGDVAAHHLAPAPHLDQAGGRPVPGGEVV